MQRAVVSIAIGAAVAACSGSSTETVNEENPTLGAPATNGPAKDDPGPIPGGGGKGGPVDRGDAGSDATTETASVGGCASCTAGSCGKELQACAGARACVDGLVAFNDCFAKQTDGTSGTCGATFAKTSAAADTLWSCLETKCAARCGVD